MLHISSIGTISRTLQVDVWTSKPSTWYFNDSKSNWERKS